MELLTSTALSLTVSSFAGAVAYGVACKQPNEQTNMVLITCLYLFFGCIYALFMGSVVVPTLILTGFIASFFGARAHRKLTPNADTGSSESFQILFKATLISVIFGVMSAILLASGSRRILLAKHGEIVVWLYFLSLMTTPGMMPFLLWMQQSSKLRPGVDKHFDE